MGAPPRFPKWTAVTIHYRVSKVQKSTFENGCSTEISEVDGYRDPRNFLTCDKFWKVSDLVFYW
jgi:hypothetical protein